MGSMSVGVAVLAGALGGAGLALFLAALVPTAGTSLRVRLWRTLRERHRGLRLAASAAAGCGMWMVTGWPVAGLLGIAGTWWLPALLGPDRAHQARVARIEAVAAWTEQIRDLMASASGLQQAITTTAPIAPEPIRASVQRLADQVRQGRSAAQALAEWAEEVNVPTADVVAQALSRAADRYAADLGTLLTSLAASTREQAGMLVKIAAARMRVRTAMRIITATTTVMATLLLAFNPDYLQPYDGLLGQLVLAAIGAVWATALGWIARLSRSDLGPRVLRPQNTQEVVQ